MTTKTQERTQAAWTLTRHCAFLSEPEVVAETGVTRTTVKRMRTRRRQIEEAGLPLPATRKAARTNVLPSDDEVDVIDPAAYEQACQRRDNPKPSLRITIANLFTRTAAYGGGSHRGDLVMQNDTREVDQQWPLI